MTEEEKKENRKDNLIDWLKTILIMLLIFLVGYLLNQFVVSNNPISGNSMQPNFQNGERVMAVRHAAIKRGDVVIIDAPDKPGEMYIKRVIGLPGEKLVSKNQQIYIDGYKLPQPWLKQARKLIDTEKGFKGLHYSTTQKFDLKLLAQTNAFSENTPSSDLAYIQKTGRIPKGTYFVMGDHRSISNDSRYIGVIPRSKIVGVVKLRYWPLNKINLVNNK